MDIYLSTEKGRVGGVKESLRPSFRPYVVRLWLLLLADAAADLGLPFSKKERKRRRKKN